MTDPRMNKGTGWEQDRSNADRRRYDTSRQGIDMEDRREEDMMDKVKKTYYDAKEKVAEKVHEGLDYLSGENKRDEDMSKKVKRGYRDAKDTVSDKSEDMKNSMRRSYRDSKEKISDESEDMMDKMKNTYQNTKEKVAEKVHEGLDYISGDRDRDDTRAGRDLDRATGMGTRRVTSQEGNRLLEGDKPIDIVCVDGSRGADKAIKYAFKNLPKSHSFLLVHGIYSPITGRSSKDDDWESMRLEKKYRSLCRETGRECAFMHFNFTSNNDFGDRVCRYARYNNVKSVVLGRREDVSDLRRTFLGSSSQAVLNHCSTPVTMVSDEAKESYIE